MANKPVSVAKKILVKPIYLFNSKGYTLVEIAVAMSILFILSVILISRMKIPQFQLGIQWVGLWTCELDGREVVLHITSPAFNQDGSIIGNYIDEEEWDREIGTLRYDSSKSELPHKLVVDIFHPDLTSDNYWVIEQNTSGLTATGVSNWKMNDYEVTCIKN